MMKPFGAFLMIVALGACSSPTTPPIAPAPPAPKGTTANEIYELRERCAKDSMEWFKQNYPEPQDPIPVQGGGGISSLPATYQNHYSEAHNGCFALVYQMTYDKHGVQPNPKDSVFQSNTLWDVNENSQLGAYVVKDLSEITVCNVQDTKCMTKEEWMQLAKTYIAE
jgi:hypothetical protein